MGFRRRVERRLGVLCVYGAWALMVWYLFFFGRHIYKLLADPSEMAFVKAWLVGLAFQNCYGLLGFAKELGRGVLVLLWLEPLFVPRGKWMEDHLDFVSVQARLAGREGDESVGVAPRVCGFHSCACEVFSC